MQAIWELSALCSQFFCESKTILKLKAYFLGEKKIIHTLQTWLPQFQTCSLVEEDIF